MGNVFIEDKLNQIKVIKKRVFFFFLDFRDSACRAGDTGDVGSTLGLGRCPGGKMATHSSILAGKISWTEEPGGLQSMGSPKVGYK